MAGIDVPVRSMRAQIASAIHVVMQLERMSDGTRRLVSLQEITGMESDVISMHEIFRYQRRKTDADGKIHGDYRATGIRPAFLDELRTRGIEVPLDMFRPDRILS
jgi:pilus assembly protein CpaF